MWCLLQNFTVNPSFNSKDSEKTHHPLRKLPLMYKAGIACSDVPSLVPSAPGVELVTSLERRKPNGEMH